MIGKPLGEQSSTMLTAQETALVIEKLASLYLIPGMENRRVHAALKVAAKIISSQRGNLFGRQSDKIVRREVDNADLNNRLSSMSIVEVRNFIDRIDITKASAISLGHIRFGIPKSRLAKLSKDDVLDAIDAAADNEESLDIIAHNADYSGKQRKA